jgi:hypothetical protein
VKHDMHRYCKRWPEFDLVFLTDSEHTMFYYLHLMAT